MIAADSRTGIARLAINRASFSFWHVASKHAACRQENSKEARFERNPLSRSCWRAQPLHAPKPLSSVPALQTVQAQARRTCIAVARSARCSICAGGGSARAAPPAAAT